MSVRLRLKRFGRRHRPFYRVTAVDQRKKRDGKVIEELGFYDPLEPNEERQVSLKHARIEHWLSVGAQPSETVRSLIKRSKVESETESKTESGAESGAD